MLTCNGYTVFAYLPENLADWENCISSKQCSRKVFETSVFVRVDLARGLHHSIEYVIIFCQSVLYLDSRKKIAIFAHPQLHAISAWYLVDMAELESFFCEERSSNELFMLQQVLSPSRWCGIFVKCIPKNRKNYVIHFCRLGQGHVEIVRTLAQKSTLSKLPNFS